MSIWVRNLLGEKEITFYLFNVGKNVKRFHAKLQSVEAEKTLSCLCILCVKPGETNFIYTADAGAGATSRKPFP